MIPPLEFILMGIGSYLTYRAVMTPAPSEEAPAMDLRAARLQGLA